MKQKDWILIAVVVFVSALSSFILSGLVINNPKNRTQKVEIIEAISSDFSKPDEKYFNSKSVDPTQLIHIGDNTNATPFKNEVTP